MSLYVALSFCEKSFNYMIISYLPTYLNLGISNAFKLASTIKQKEIRMKLIKHDAFSSDPWTDLDRFLETTLPELATWNSFRSVNSNRAIPLDVHETDSERIVRLELPGFSRKEINLELEKAILKVTAEREDKRSGKKLRFDRSFSIGEEVDNDKISAELDHGILEIHLPKQEQAKPRQIAIN
jgi:HSP20 family protein